MKAVVFGAGKIARGFLGQLLYRSKCHTTYVDINKKLIGQLNETGRYYVNVMGNEKESEWITDYDCVALDDIRSIAEKLYGADVIFTSVGGKNLESIGKTIANAFRISGIPDRLITIICCENWKEPGQRLKNCIIDAFSNEAFKMAFEQHIGVTDAVIMRSAVEPAQQIIDIDKNAVSVNNFWELPVDKTRVKGVDINITGLKYLDNFGGFLLQKLYTFNATNSTIAYIGSLLGIKDLAEAANDPRIIAILHDVHKEINSALPAELGIPVNDQISFSKKAIQKYQDRYVTDFTERHARDPIRKLGPEDRIVGTARVLERHSVEPDGLCTTLAAALYYDSDNEDDPSAAQLRALRDTKGIDYILENICKIGRDEPIAKNVTEKIRELKSRGWIHEHR